ncbi:MAG: hypothetical protein OXG82_02515 [Gammaproteobacteria bacterium]|nr:hypothetical protein [Gammaproteobacteria bacterium]
MQVDETRGDDQVAGVDDTRGVRFAHASDLGDAPVGDRDVARVAGGPLTVDHRSALEQEVVERH